MVTLLAPNLSLVETDADHVKGVVFNLVLLVWRYRTLLVRPLPTEAVKFSVLDAAEKCVPFVRRELENRPSGVPALAEGGLCHTP